MLSKIVEIHFHPKARRWRFYVVILPDRLGGVGFENIEDALEHVRERVARLS